MRKRIGMALCGAMLLVALTIGCTNPDGAKSVLRQQGYTNIVITGYRPMMGDKNDTYCTGFEATAPNGERVTGAVTEGAFKGKTVRFD